MNNEENDSIYRGILYNSVAEQLTKAVSDNNRYRKPMDTTAFRLANEYVIQYLLSHGMELTEQAAGKESNSYLIERHNSTWVARKLKIDHNQSLFPQLVKVLHKDEPETSSTTESDNFEDQPKMKTRGLPKVPEEIRSRSIANEERILQSSDEGIFTEMFSFDGQETEEGQTYRQKPIFTILEEDVEDKKKKTTSRLYPPKKVKEPKRSTFKNSRVTGTMIDTL